MLIVGIFSLKYQLFIDIKIETPKKNNPKPLIYIYEYTQISKFIRNNYNFF